MASHELTEHNGADMPPRFYVDGIRVSKARFQDIKDRAYMSGRLESMVSKGRQMPGGRIRRTNHCVATI